MAAVTKKQKTPSRTLSSKASKHNHNIAVTAAIGIGLAGLVWIAFGQTTHNDFVNYDDGDYVYENPNVSAGLTIRGVQWAFTHVHAANWHPLTTISHMLDVQLYGLQPWGHHLTNVLLHATAAVLLFLALLKLTTNVVADPLCRGEGSERTRRQSAVATQSVRSAVIDRRYNFWACAFVAALFAIHPLRVESVAWISERKDVLSGVFFMLTLLAYARYARTEQCSHGALSPCSGRTPRQSGAATAFVALRPGGAVATRWYLIVIVLFALGLMCKPTLVTLPFVLLLLDYWPLGRWPRAGSTEQGAEIRSQKSVVSSQESAFQRFRFSAFHNVGGLLVEKIPLFLLSAASCVATVLAQKKALDTDLRLNIAERAGNAVVSYIVYIGQMIYPARLTVSYPYGPLKVPPVILAAILLLTISTALFIYRKQYPFLLTGWLWYLGSLVPMIGLVQVGLQSRADRYTYLSQIGLYIMIAWGVAAIIAHWPSRRAIATIIGLLTIGALTLSSRAQTSYWRNSQSLWEHAIESTSANYIAYNNLGTVFLRQKHPDAAIVQFQKAIEIKPDFENAYVSAGSALMRIGQIDQAIEYYEKALELRPNSAEDWSNLATALLKQGKNEEAIAGYKKAAALKPDSAEMQYNLGRALANNGEWSDAITCYRAAIRLQPDDEKFHNNLAVALLRTGMSDEALAELRQALQLNPNYAEAHYNLGCVLAYLGRKEEAAMHLTEALRLKPDYSDAEKQLHELGLPPPQ